MIGGVLCQKKVAGVERWFKFDGDLTNSGSLSSVATLVTGSVSYSVTNAERGQSITPSNTNITTSPNYALGANFYVEFYATWTDDGIFNTVVSSASGFDVSKTGYSGGKIRVDVVGESVRLTSAAAYADGIKRKYKVTFIAGVISLYVNDVLTDTGTTTVTNFPIEKSAIRLLYGSPTGGAQSGHYDDLIIQRL